MIRPRNSACRPGQVSVWRCRTDDVDRVLYKGENVSLGGGGGR